MLPRITWSPFVVLSFSVLFLVPSSANSVAHDDMGEAIDHAKSLSRAFRHAAEETIPSVVTVIAKAKPRLGRNRDELRELLDDPRFRGMFPGGELPLDGSEDDPESAISPIPTQIGAGVIIDAEGVILTNSHVVEGADEIIVRLKDGQELKVVDVKTDPKSDLAVVRISPKQKLKPAQLGDSSQLNIGDWVIAIGSPFELEATVSAGIISGKGRGIEKIERGTLLQTDAAINPGNSGGPLVNLDGEVVGLNTAIATRNGGYQGIGFAIPVNRAKWVSRELLDHGQVRRAYLGIYIDELTPQAAEALNLPPRSGVYVKDVVEGGAADVAGLKTNDVVIEFAGERVLGPQDLQDVVEQKPIDSQQAVKIMRDGKAVTLKVTLQALSEE